MNSPISVLIASGHDNDQKRILAALPEQDFLLASVEKDEPGAIIRSERLKPDVLILDFQLSVTDYPQLVRIIQRRSPSTAIIFLSNKDEDNLAYLLFKAGISGFLLKDEDFSNLALAVKIIFSGGCYISASVFSKVINKAVSISQFPGQVTEQNDRVFSPVERGIVTDLANGLSDNQIAEHLNYSEGSIKNILTAIKRRTKLRNRIQLVVFALVSGQLRFEHLWLWKN